MFFADWYFCNTLKMSVADANDYLEFLFTLGEDARSLKEKNAALDWLAGQEESLLQAYAIPQLVQGILTENAMECTLQEYEEQEWRIYLQKSKKLISGILENIEQVSQIGSCLNLVQNMDEMEHKELVDQVLALPCIELDHACEFNYLESDEYAYVIVLLSVLCTVAKKDSKMVSEAVSESNSKFISMALDKKFGILPWKLAMFLRCFCSVTFHELEESFPDGWLGSVECLEIAALLMLEKEKESGKSPQSVVEDLLEESCNLVFWEKNYRHIPGEEFWINEKADRSKRFKICAVLWQNVLWNTVFEYNAEVCIEKLRQLWNVPVYGKAKRTGTRRRRNLLIPVDAKVTNMDQCFGFYFCTPWQKRTRKKTERTEYGEPFQEFEDMIHNESAFRLFAAAILLRRMMGYVREFPIEYCRILLNMGDVFQCDDINRELTGKQNHWENPVKILGYFAEQCIGMLGRGELNNLIPSKMITMIYNGRKKEKNNPQLNEQYRITGIQVCAHWAVESLRSAGIRQKWMIDSPWFVGGVTSCAAQLCKWFFQDGIQWENYDYREPLLLCFQAFPEEYRQIVRDCGCGSWMEKYSESEEKITFCDIMLSEEPFIEEWENLKKLNKDRFAEEIWLTVLTMRLLIWLKSGKTEDNTTWYMEWRDGIAAHASTGDTYGMVFYLLCELLAVKFPDNRMPFIYSEIVKIVIGTIHSYTTEKTIFYQYYMTMILKDAWRNYGLKTGAMAIGENVRELYIKRDSEKERKLLEYSLVQALVQAQDEMPFDILKDVYGILKRYLEQCCASGKHHAIVRLSEDEWNPLTDFELQENHGQFSVIRPVQNTSRVFSAATKDLFKSPLGAESSGWYVGIIINDVRYGERNEEKEYFVQYGTGNRGYCTSRAYYRKGETVGVYLNQKGELNRISKLAWKDDEKSLEVKVMELSASTLKLRLPNGEIVFRSEHQSQEYHTLLTLWEPDTSHILQMRTSDGWEEPVREVRLDEKAEFYIPVERNFYRLILEGFFNQAGFEQILRMVYICESDQNGKRGFLFSAKTGINYFLLEENWEQRSFERLEKKLEEGNYLQGLIVTVGLQIKEGRMVLTLAGEHPFDTKNWEWASYFSEEEFFVVQKGRQTHGDEWYANINVPGMPQQVKAIFSPFNNAVSADICNVQLGDDGWNIDHQRQGIVRVEKLQSRGLKKSWCTPERFRRLYQINVGDILVLENSRLSRQREGYRSMLTDSGLPVLCAAESLSLEAGHNLTTDMISGRVCVVENTDVWETKRESECEAVDVPALQEGGEYVEGIVSQFTEEVNTTDGDVRKLSLGVWLSLEKEVVSVVIPVSAFESRPKALGAPVTAIRQNDGKWLFQAYIRRIQVRALWQIEDHRADKNSMIEGICIGRNMNVPGYGQCLVTQSKERPVLYLWNTDRVQKGQENSYCGVEIGKGSVSKIKRRNFPWEVFPYAKYKELVRLVEDGKEYYGDCRWGEFDDTAKGVNWSVSASVYLFRADDEKQYYDVRRNFYSRSIKQKPEDMKRSEKESEQLDEQYEAWINGGDYHVIGTEILDKQEKKLRIDNLKVPESIGRETLRDNWTDKVSFSEEDRLWVPGRYYPKNRVRALLMRKDDVWVASCHEAAPFFVSDELAREFNVASGDIIRRKIYYAGLDEYNRLRFEWGYGFSFLVDEEDILDEDGHKIANNLFYGDMIMYFRMIRGEGRYGWCIRVEYKALVRQVERRVWEDSFGGKAVIQLLEIRRNLQKGKVSVERVSVTEEVIQQRAGLFNSWDFHKISSAKLEEESVLTLLEEEGYEQDTKIIFAQLKPEADKSRVTSLTFTYVPLDGKRGDTWLLEGQVVCMTAGEINVTGGEGQRQENRLSNDYVISLFLPNELDKKNPQMCVNVLRREFSVDESKLRTLYRDNMRRYYGCKMLVRLKSRNEANDNRSEWKGNIISTPKRTRESLEEWIKGQDHCLVTLGLENKQLLAEVAPGIITHLPQNAIQGTFSQGTLVTLWMEDGGLKGEAVLSGDRKYLSEVGRPAELLIMDGAAKNYKKLQQEVRDPGSLSVEECQKINRELNKPQFTVAGLPQILLSDRALLEVKILEQIPRLAYLVREQGQGADENAEIRVLEKMRFHSARLFLNQSEEPELHYFYPQEQITVAEWGQISFMDGTVAELTAFVKRGRWHYHDRKTARYHPDEHYLEAVPLPNGKNYNEIILFPNRKGRLRYQQKEFLKYGYPAREVMENGLPEEHGEYPVAGVTENSIWIEIFPGKLLEIPVAYLFAGEKKISLSGLWTGMLSEGDRLRFCHDEGFAGNQKKLLLEEVVFGGRAGFGKRNTFFPIQSILEDGLTLGTNLWSVTLPVKERWCNQEIVCITPENAILPLKNSQKVYQEDVLLVNCDTEYLSVTGWGNLKVTPAYRYLWENTEWLLDDILSHDGNGWMKESGLTLPMEVANARYKDGALQAWVFYRQPDMELLPCETKLCCICVGLRQKREGFQEIVVRSGRALLSIPVQHILPGIESWKISAVVKELRKEKTSFWIHKEQEGWHSGLRKTLEKERLEIHMLFCIEEANGILCQTRDNLALRWLPAKRAARVGQVTLGILWKGLRRRVDRSARRLDDGTLSLIEIWQNEQKYSILKTDGTRYRATPVEKVNTDEREVSLYLAELYPKGDLICLYSEDEYDCDKEDVIPIEIGEKQMDCVTSFPYGMRRRKLHLTPWVCQAIGNASEIDDFDRFEELSLLRFQNEIPECFERYRQIPIKANQDSQKKQLDYELLRDHHRISEQLIYLYAVISKKRDKELNFNEVYEFIRLTLKAWLEKEGKFLASGLDLQRRNEQTEQIDVAPVISAILLLHSIKGKTGDGKLEQVAKPLSVHLTRMLGISCGSSIHQEILLKQWLLQRKEGIWLRLNQLSLRGENHLGQASAVFDGQLTPKQVRRLLDICNSLRMHAFCDKKLELVVESLLLSCGCLEECDLFYSEMQLQNCIMERLSTMGRILTPNAGSSIAKSSLSQEEVNTLKDLWILLLRKNSLPLSLVTDTEIPVSEIVKKNGIDYCTDFCRLVTPVRKRILG